MLMTLNNGQAITLSNQLKDKGVTDGASLASLMKKESANTPSRRPSRQERTRCGSITGLPPTASIR